EICQIQRTRTNTPLQALVTLNDPVYIEAAVVWADRLMAGNQKMDKRIETAYYEATFRKLKADKGEALLKLYEQAIGHFGKDEKGLIDYLSIRPDIYNQKNNRLELAALSVVCSAIMNLDEFLTKT